MGAEPEPISIWTEAKHPLRAGWDAWQIAMIPKAQSLVGETGQEKYCVFVTRASRAEEAQRSSPAELRLCEVSLE